MLGDFSRQARVLLAAAAVGAVGIAGLPGCTSVIYDSNPEGVPLPEDEKPDFASHTVLNLMATSIAWASERHPPPVDENEGWFAINLPEGVTREQYIEVATRIGDRAAPITPETEYLPTYHIGWVWMRGDHARVDVFRPVFSLSRNGEPVTQAITLHLRRRFASWRVEQTQPWDTGVVPLPPVYYMPPPEEDAEGVPAEAGSNSEEWTETEPEAVPAPEEPVETSEDPAVDLTE